MKLSYRYTHGFIRQIKNNNGIEMIRGIYPAVRDENWGTIDYQITNEKIRKNNIEHRVQATLHFGKDRELFTADIEIIIRSSEIIYHFDGKVLSTFLKNRIGLNLLLPIDHLAGSECIITHSDQYSSKNQFPYDIAPHQPFKDIEQLEWTDQLGNHILIEFKGDIFEIEDQRNWTDASYKIYSTPLNLPFPLKVSKGDQVSQTIIIKILKLSETKTHRKSEVHQQIKSFHPLPLIGLAASSEKDRLDQDEISKLKHANFRYIQAQCDLTTANWHQKLTKNMDDAKDLETQLKISILLHSETPASTVSELIDTLTQNNNILFGIEIFDKYSFVTSGKHIDLMLQQIRKCFPDLKTGGGTYAYYAELNRAKNLISDLDYITYSISPQVHAFDELSIMENIDGAGYTVMDAKKKFKKPVDICAVTLKQRMNFVATSNKHPEIKYETIDPSVDVRQQMEFTAHWTHLFIEKMKACGAQSITLFETVGQRGIMQSNTPKKGFGLFTEEPLQSYPVFALLKEI